MRTAFGLVGAFLMAFGLAVLDGGWPPRRYPANELSCAAFPVDLTEQDLVARFGAENVTSGSITGGDDGPQDGTIVFAGDSTRRLEIFWNDETKRGASWITAEHAGGVWRTRTGVAVGEELKGIERRNGVPFRLNGFAREASGRIESWASGRLQMPKSPGCEEIIELGLRYDGTEDQALIRQLSGTQQYSSGHPAMQGLNPTVVSIALYYERPTRLP
jgi:hypothetical protein